MGQKVNPIALRLGYTKNWRSLWFAERRDFANNIKVDYSNYSTLKITSLKGESKIKAIKWLDLMRKRKMLSEENYNLIEK